MNPITREERYACTKCLKLVRTGRRSHEKMRDYAFYCTAGVRPRKIAYIFEYTGLVPKWCPRLDPEEKE